MTDTIRPGGTIGILGGDTMSHLLALTARGMGYRVRVLDTGPGARVTTVRRRSGRFRHG